jgi:hypothetical protein
MGLMARMKAAGVIFAAKKAVVKARIQGVLRRRMIDALLKKARAAGAKDVEQKVLHMRSYSDRYFGALVEQEEMLDNIDIMKADDGEIDQFLADMQTQQDRIDTFSDLYKDMKKKAYAMLKDQEESYGGKLLDWIKKDSIGSELLAQLFKQITSAVESAAKSQIGVK